MAVWQVEFAIVPRRALTTTPRVTLSQILDTDWWTSERLPAGYSQQLAAIAPAGSARTTEHQTWGEPPLFHLWRRLDGKPVDLFFVQQAVLGDELLVPGVEISDLLELAAESVVR